MTRKVYRQHTNRIDSAERERHHLSVVRATKWHIIQSYTKQDSYSDNRALIQKFLICKATH